MSGRAVFNTLRKRSYSFTLLCFSIGTITVAPFFWIGYGWISFLSECSEIKPLKKLALFEQPRSVLLRLDPGKNFAKEFNIQITQVLGDSVCVETEGAFGFSHRCGNDYALTTEPISQYVLSVNIETSKSGLGYLLTYQVKSLAVPHVTAEAKEAIFGRGLISSYIGLLTGSNNPEYLACGYVNNENRVWRNSRSGVSYPEYEAYRSADRNLFADAMNQAKTR